MSIKETNDKIIDILAKAHQEIENLYDGCPNYIREHAGDVLYNLIKHLIEQREYEE